jgi:hypothetical protein
MVVIKFATYTTRCPFSMALIKPSNQICLFNEEQFEAFKRIINEELIKFFPLEIIDLIIEKTKYKKLIGSFGHANVSHWTRKNNQSLHYNFDRVLKLEKEKFDEIEECEWMNMSFGNETDESDEENNE